MCFYNDGDYSAIWRQEIRKARKAHYCEECSEGVLPGEMYMYVASLYDGHWYTHKFCRRCRFDSARIYDWERAEGCGHSESLAPIGEVREALAERDMEPTERSEVPADYKVASCSWKWVEPSRLTKVSKAS